MYTLTVKCNTTDELQEVVNLLSGVAGTAVSGGEDDETPAAPAKKATPTAKNAAATKAAFKEPAKAAAAPAVKGKAKVTKAPTVEGLKDHILEHAGYNENASDEDNASVNTNVKAYVASFGVKKISDMDDATRIKALADAEEYFASLGGEDEEGEEDPMA